MGFGIDSMKTAIKKAVSSQGGYSGKLLYFNLKDGESKVLRFLTDGPDILTVDFYEYIVDNKGTTQNFIVYPNLHEGENVPDWVLRYGGKMREKGLHGDLVDPIARRRTVAIAVLQEEAPRTVNGKTVIGYQDVIEEIDVKGEKYPARQFLIVKQAHKNFWQPLVGFHDEYQTLCDRPYKITRSGATMNDTSYQIVPKSPDTDNFDLKEHYAAYGYGEHRDDNDPERFLYCPQTLAEWAEWYGGEDRVKLFLGDPKKQAAEARTAPSTPAHTPSGNDEFHKDTTHNPAPEQEAAAPPPATDFSSLRARLEKHKV